MTTTITEPGLYQMGEDEYHADPVPDWSLSASGAKLLLDPHCPAHYLADRLTPRTPTKALEYGRAAHDMVLGTGAGVATIPAELLSADGGVRSNEAKAARDELVAQGLTVVKADELAAIQAMADKLRAHPIASLAFDPERGKPEQSLFWRDEQHGIWRRARLDWLPDPNSGRLIIADYKTARSAHPATWLRDAAKLGCHMQDSNYRAGVANVLGLGPRDVAFVFVVQEKEPPYEVTVIELDGEARAIGDHLMDEASAVFAECRANDRWPGYADEVVQGALPYYYTRDFEGIF